MLFKVDIDREGVDRYIVTFKYLITLELEMMSSLLYFFTLKGLWWLVIQIYDEIILGL